MDATVNPLPAIALGLRQGRAIPFLGAGLLEGGGSAVPTRPEALAAALGKRVPVPSRIRRNLTAAAQYIENFRHRKVLRKLMLEIFEQTPAPVPLQRLLAGMGEIPLIIDGWYDASLLEALAARADWGQVQGVSRAEHRDQWTVWFGADGLPALESAAAQWNTLVYKPVGCIRPSGNFLVSDSDFVEVLTEIDIQTPLPRRVQELRSGRGFLFVGYRFSDQISRTWARQVMKRSGGEHWAIIEEPLTPNEERFVAEQGIRVLPMSIAAFTEALSAQLELQPA
jgi:hypothetical protein